MRAPGARWSPLAGDWWKQPRMTGHDIVCIHTMVGSLTGTGRYFGADGYRGPESHFGTGGRGEKVQWQDLRFQADANLDGRRNVISLENADMGPGFPRWDTRSADNVPPFTDEQVQSIAELVAWACDKRTHARCPSSWACHRYGIPVALIPDTRPGRRGVGYHRQGCDPYRVAGGVRWSAAYGKGCPGPARIRQVNDLIIPRARLLLAGANPEEDDVATPAENASATWNYDAGKAEDGHQPAWALLAQARTAAQSAREVATKAAQDAHGARAAAEATREAVARLEALLNDREAPGCDCPPAQ